MNIIKLKKFLNNHTHQIEGHIFSYYLKYATLFVKTFMMLQNMKEKIQVVSIVY